MPRIKVISSAEASEKATVLLDSVRSQFGMIPNMMSEMANAAAVLDGYLKMSNALSGGSLSAKVREQLALAIAQANGCEYCVAAHSAVGKMLGVTADQLTESRRGSAGDPKTAALIDLARKVLDSRGRVSDADLEIVRGVGYDDGAIAEVVAHVALNVFTNYFNNLAQTVIDFPKAPTL